MRLILGDCLEKIKELDTNSIDSIVTDPPYELGFMGKAWDSTGIANNVDMWRECLRVLKPGGHLLAFSGTRTYHRMASAIEDAGFEVRDMIEWVYGSGFPKSLNIGKAVDKLQGNERKKVSSYRTGEGANFKHSGDGREQFHEAEAKEIDVTKGTSEWEGWGTALKPAHEPICLARKPLSEKTVAENCLKWGTGGINIDGSRVEMTEQDIAEVKAKANKKDTTNNIIKGFGNNTAQFGDWEMSKGRFPANLIHDNSDEVRECFPETKGGGSQRGSRKWKGEDGEGGFGGWAGKVSTDHYVSRDDGTGNASRFFKSIIYQSKASKSERNKGCEDMPLRHYLKGNKMGGEGDTMLTGSGNPRDSRKHNNHPTVKPTKLMEYLISMVTREGQVVLDPFMGSGTTGVACKNLNRNFIGIELDEEYIKIAQGRIGL